MDVNEVKRHLLQNLDFEPTKDQNLFLQKIGMFLADPRFKDLFILRGYAGTGKTTMLSTIVKTLPSLKLKTVLLAPTGRAAKVMSLYSGTTAFTIHKKIYWLEENTGEMRFSLGKNKHTNTLFIVDEASMIQGFTPGSYSNLLDDLVSYVYSGKNCKLLLVGDIAQLPPVGSELSPALIPSYFRDEFHFTIDGVELKEVVRQEADSGILANATVLRDNIETEHFELNISTKPYSDICNITGSELEEYLNSAYSEYGEEEVLVVTRSNKRANLFNQQIRNRILYREEEIAAGDLLMVVKNNYHWLDPKSKAGFIANGDTFSVNRVFGYEEFHGYKFANVSGYLVDYPDEPELEVKIIVDTIHVEAPALSQEDNERLFWSVYEDYFDAKSKSERMQKVKNDPFYNALQVKFAYAVTCHKAQGGQWPVVFIDQGYLTEEMLNKELMRWMYTAFTRSTQYLYLVNFNQNFLAD